MSALQPSSLSIDRRVPSDCPKRYSNYSQLFEDVEDVMADSALTRTPPLDLESDSGIDDDLDFSMQSPISPPTFQPASILQRRRKDSQEGPLSVNLLDSSQRQRDEVSHVVAPTLAGYGRAGPQGRRPTVTFDLDSVIQRPNRSDHDDVFSLVQSGSPAFCQDSATSVQQTEQALRRVSISLPDCHDNDDNHGNEQPEMERTPIAPLSSQESIVKGPLVLDQILTDPVPQEMLVALFDRPSELKALAARHLDFFSLIYSSVPKTAVDQLKTLLFQPREIVGDREWIQSIAKYLGPLPPCILEKFKGMVGWIGPDDDDDDDSDGGFRDDDEYCYRDSSLENVQIKWLRDVKGLTFELLQEHYPQFFVNARESLQGRRQSFGGDRRDLYIIFCETLSLTRERLACDNAWTRRMNGCLDKNPELMLQLKEIVAYESEYDY